MARHPMLSERLSKTVTVFFKGASRRVSRSRSKLSRHRSASVKPKAGSSKLSTPKIDRSAKDKANTSPEKSSKAPGKSSKLRTFWSNLFWVRPWLLVMALWLTFIVMIAIALTGLSSPGREMVLDPVDNSLVGHPLSAPDAAAASRLVPSDNAVLPQRDPAATLPPAAQRSMPAWPLLLMVVACAGGCMLMSNQGLLASSDSRRGRRRGANVQPTTPRTVGQRAVRSTSKRNRRTRRLTGQRPASQVMAFRPGKRLRNTTPKRRPMASKPVSFAVNDHDKDEPAPSVTVVPDNETSPLDWKEGSLAHKLDVRQTRSIRSFL